MRNSHPAAWVRVWGRIWRLIAPRWPLALAAVGCMTLTAISTAFYAWVAGPLLRALYEAAAGSETLGWAPAPVAALLSTPTRLTLALGLLIAATATVRAGANYGQQTLLARLSQQTLRELRVTLYAHLLRLTPASLRQYRSGELGTRIATEVVRVQSLLNMGAAPLARNGVTAISLIALAFSLDPLLALVATAALPPIGWLVARLSHRTRQAYQDSWGAQSHLAGTASETAQLASVVRAFEAESHAERVFRTQADRAEDLALQAARLRARLGPAMELLGACAVVAALALAAHRLQSGALGPDRAVSFFAALFFLYRPVQSMGMMLHSLSGGMAALDRIDQLLALEAHGDDRDRPAPAPALAPMRRELRLDRVSFSYGENAPAVLREVGFTVRAGESVAIVGASGEGKTTLLTLVLGLLEPTRGSVRIDGTDLRAARPDSVRAQFGWVGQEPLLFADTVLANIALGDPQPDRARAEQAARDAGAHEFVAALPQRYDTPLVEGGTNLSAGQRQRLCIARALYRDAPILLLDEPTAALDGPAERELGQTIDALLSGGRATRTVLLASHRERTVERVDRVLVLSQGRIVEDGPPQELRSRGGEFRALFADGAEP